MPYPLGHGARWKEPLPYFCAIDNRHWACSKHDARNHAGRTSGILHFVGDANQPAASFAYCPSVCNKLHLLVVAGTLAQLSKYLHTDKWTHWDLNPGPSACEADVIPLHHVPLNIDL